MLLNWLSGWTQDIGVRLNYSLEKDMCSVHAQRDSCLAPWSSPPTTENIQGKLIMQMILYVKGTRYKVTHKGKIPAGQAAAAPNPSQGQGASCHPSPPFPALKQTVLKVPDVDRNMPFASL